MLDNIAALSLHPFFVYTSVLTSTKSVSVGDCMILRLMRELEAVETASPRDAAELSLLDIPR